VVDYGSAINPISPHRSVPSIGLTPIRCAGGAAFGGKARNGPRSPKGKRPLTVLISEKLIGEAKIAAIGPMDDAIGSRRP
jgi:hypothetical protein